MCEHFYPHIRKIKEPATNYLHTSVWKTLHMCVIIVNFSLLHRHLQKSYSNNCDYGENNNIWINNTATNSLRDVSYMFACLYAYEPRRGGKRIYPPPRPQKQEHVYMVYCACKSLQEKEK